MKNNTIRSTDHHPQDLRQTVYDKNTYTYARVAEIIINENKPPVASKINLPLEADGPATCLVYFVTY